MAEARKIQQKIVSREEWIAARKAHLRNEKALTRMRDLVSAERRTLPWVKVEEDYVFDAPGGRKRLGELFDGRSQLIVHHFMFGPHWDAGCPSCSLVADHAEGALPHLENHDVAFVRVSRAPLAKIEAYRKRMGWKARWVSSHGTSFNYDFHVSFTPEQLRSGRIDYNYETIEDPKYHCDEMHGLSVFYRNEGGEIFHTYSTYARGYEQMVAADEAIGFAHYVARCGGPGPDGEMKGGYMRATVCCRKIDGKWLIVHEHYSAPFDMESGKALMDLTP